MTLQRTRRSALLTLAGATLLAGCASLSPPETTRVGAALGLDEVSARQARFASFDLAETTMSRIELTADSIAAVTTDPEVRRRSLEWKAHGVPAVQRAMFQPDPFLAYLDGWVLVHQMHDFFESGGGTGYFGPHQDLAIETLARLEELIREDAAITQSPEVLDRIGGIVRDWAEERPLDNSRYLRPSVAQEATRLLADEQLGGLSALGSVEAMAVDAQYTALILAGFLPREILWQVQLATGELLDTAAISPMLAAVDNMALTRAMTRLADEMPGLVAGERAVILRAVAAERAAILAGTGELTAATLDATFEGVAAERAAVMAELRALIAEERAILLAALDSSTGAAFDEVRATVDHVILRLVQVGVAFLLLMGIIGALVWRSVSPTLRSREPTA